MTASPDDRIIHTKLYTQKACDVMDSVFGQLSDGWGKNNWRNDRYWMFGDASVELDGEAVIRISSSPGKWYGRQWIENAFTHMSDFEVRAWMARMIKKTMTMELRDEGISNGWKRDNISFMTCYLNRDIEISVAEVYCMYEMLLDRQVGITKYDSSVIAGACGRMRIPEETEDAKKLQDAVKAVNDAYAEKVKQLNEEEKAEIDKLMAKIDEVKKQFALKRNDAITEKLEKLKSIA